MLHIILCMCVFNITHNIRQALIVFLLPVAALLMEQNGKTGGNLLNSGKCSSVSCILPFKAAKKKTETNRQPW